MDAILEGFFALVRLLIWAVCFAAAAVFGPPVIAIWTRLDGSQPYWPTFWSRYGRALFWAFSSPP